MRERISIPAHEECLKFVRPRPDGRLYWPDERSAPCRAGKVCRICQGNPMHWSINGGFCQGQPLTKQYKVVAQGGGCQGSPGAAFGHAGTRRSTLWVLLGLSSPGFVEEYLVPAECPKLSFVVASNGVPPASRHPQHSPFAQRFYLPRDDLIPARRCTFGPVLLQSLSLQPPTWDQCLQSLTTCTVPPMCCITHCIRCLQSDSACCR